MNFVPPLLLDVPQHRKSQNRIFFAFSPVFSPTNFRAIFWKKARMKIDTESCPSGRRCSTRNLWKLRPFRPLKMSTVQGFAWVRISQFHIVLACFSCIFSAHGKQLRYTEGYRRGHNENDSKSCFHFGSPNCRKASNHAGLRASSNCELGSVLSCCSSQFPRLEFCGKMAIMRAAI